MSVELINGDCLEQMASLESGSVDMVLTDPPYGTTQNKWDSIIPLEPMWAELKRLTKPNGAIVLFSDGLFTSTLKLSNAKLWRYDIVWDKVLVSGFLNANRMPLRSHEIMSVFYSKLPAYNPQKTKGAPNHSKGTKKEYENNNYGSYDFVDNADKLGDMKHPKSVYTCEKPHPSKCDHPTQKPVALMEYLIKTYTDEGMVVLDFTMGSGTTGVACANLDREFVGIELDSNYFSIAQKRINEAIGTRQLAMDF